MKKQNIILFTSLFLFIGSIIISLIFPGASNKYSGISGYFLALRIFSAIFYVGALLYYDMNLIINISKGKLNNKWSYIVFSVLLTLLTIVASPIILYIGVFMFAG